jgi:hypothetical protein
MKTFEKVKKFGMFRHACETREGEDAQEGRTLSNLCHQAAAENGWLAI